MKIRITAGGIYDGDGKEIEVGTELTVKSEPKAWAGRYVIVSGKASDDSVAVTNDPPKGPFEVKDAGSGWFSLHDADGAQIGKKLRKDDAEAFEGLSDEDKAEFAAEHAKD